MIYPDAKHIPLRTWANRLVDTFPAAAIPTFFEPWQRWATAVIQVPFFATYAPPEPRHYKTWFDWAHDFYKIANWITPQS